ncbi:MAG TPA: hypothetical protein DCX25_00825 [Candidatus Pacebacteria bacterium]|nr:MAG: hypothetical protein UX35_C0016G0030 [Microgenomates group bacterium GW2011_GWA1_46_15]KKU24049.1 MAG: hypothetical protein UX36_C0002G0032 [Microgenomates group bacterium GW2011_GWC1_46_15]HAV14861.1 hypothetical protein [Candidatus Paceibacterota bacterium]HCR11252.1 hypothetical protein [Candidatus Paceibacterota bacterium]HCR92895.1 hypothetical protein [Candidatus Paceibacterota bacterium]
MPHEISPAPQSEHPEREMLISFGMLFYPRMGTRVLKDRIHVILGVGTGKTFFSYLIVKDPDGQWRIPAGAGGTGYVGNIGEVIGLLASEQVIEAYRRGNQKAGVPDSVGDPTWIIEQSRQPTRGLVLPSQSDAVDLD